MDKVTIGVAPQLFKNDGDVSYVTEIDGIVGESAELEVEVPR